MEPPHRLGCHLDPPRLREVFRLRGESHSVFDGGDERERVRIVAYLFVATRQPVLGGHLEHHGGRRLT
jgi:hypothetical protein